MKPLRIVLYLALAVVLLPAFAQGVMTGGGYGIIYGTDNAFALTAPSGWVLDNESGANQGVYAVFYPVGSSWADAPAVAYANAAAKDEGISDIPSLVAFNVDRFHANGSPNYRARFLKELPLSQGGRVAKVYAFDGDAWGNYEAVGYVEEELTISLVVLTCRTREAYEAALPAFEALLASYRFITDKVTFEKKPKP